MMQSCRDGKNFDCSLGRLHLLNFLQYLLRVWVLFALLRRKMRSFGVVTKVR
jgi:hypothetical protein